MHHPGAAGTGPAAGAATAESSLGQQLGRRGGQGGGPAPHPPAEKPRAKRVTRPKALLVASGGGHWAELIRVIPAFDGHEIVFVTVDRSYQVDVPNHRLHVINDANRWNKFGLMKMAARLFFILIRERPDVVFSTGAACGYFALRFGRFFGARTIWLDSIANAEELSMSGRIVGKYADLWLTQWPELARPEGPHFKGAVL